MRDQFVVDVYQAGAGTSHNMNANEVIANRAAELLGGARGTYDLVHPNDDVNMGQSTNDVFPTSTRLALLLGHDALIDAAEGSERSVPAEVRRIPRRSEDRQDASPGCGPHHLRPGVQWIRCLSAPWSRRCGTRWRTAA
ncbi:MAG: lyase family protein [Vicinamibacterales bacterium]